MLCADCGKEHPISEIELTFLRPDAVAALSEEERQARLQEGLNFCVLDGARFFVRVLLPLPVPARRDTYCVGLWVEVDQLSFERIYELWGEPAQSKEPAFAATLANEVPFSAGSLGLGASLKMVGNDSRPCVYLNSSSNSLYAEQQNGVSEHRIHEYTSLFT